MYYFQKSLVTKSALLCLRIFLQMSLSKHPRKLSEPREWRWSPSGEAAGSGSWQGLPKGDQGRGKSSERPVQHSWGWGSLPPPPADIPDMATAHTVKGILGEDATEELAPGKDSSQTSLELESSALSFSSPQLV